MPPPRLPLAILTAALLGLTACRSVTTPGTPFRQHLHNIFHPPTDAADFAGLARYGAANRNLPAHTPGRVVFFGDSITDFWPAIAGTFFPGKPYLDRGISGHTTPQMLLRFRQDVLDLHPDAVVLIAGTNDILGLTGPATQSMIEDNLSSMTELAQSHGIRVILATVPPIAAGSRDQRVHGTQRINDLNHWIAAFCASRHITFLDIHTPLADANGNLRPDLRRDDIHPNAAGYALISPLAQTAIDAALSTPRL